MGECKKPQRESNSMRVNPNNDVSGPVGGAQVSGRGKKPTQPGSVDLAHSADLGRALESIPLARADKLAKAQVLIQDPLYPDDATLRQVAGLLADHLRPVSPSE